MLHAFHAVDNNNNVQLFLKPRLHDTTRCLQPVVKPVEQPVEQPAASCKRSLKETRLRQKGRVEGRCVSYPPLWISPDQLEDLFEDHLSTSSTCLNPWRHSPCNDHFRERIALDDVSFRVSPIPYLKCMC